MKKLRGGRKMSVENGNDFVNMMLDIFEKANVKDKKLSNKDMLVSIISTSIIIWVGKH